jgi:hypothetical protein
MWTSPNGAQNPVERIDTGLTLVHRAKTTTLTILMKIFRLTRNAHPKNPTEKHLTTNNNNVTVTLLLLVLFCQKELKMTTKPPLTYVGFKEACQQLLASGEQPSVRKIHPITGGSFSTLSEYLRTWQEENILVSGSSFEISNTIRQALLSEFSRIKDVAKENLLSQFEGNSKQLKEVQSLLKEHEGLLEEKEKALLAMMRAREEESLSFEKALSASQAKTSVQKERVKLLELDVDDLKNDCEKLRISTAVAEAKAEGYAHQLSESKKKQMSGE